MTKVREIFFFYLFPFANDTVSAVHFAGESITFVPVTRNLHKIHLDSGDQMAVLATPQLFPFQMDLSLLTEEYHQRYSEFIEVHKETARLFSSLFENQGRFQQSFLDWKTNLVHLCFNGDLLESDLQDFECVLREQVVTIDTQLHGPNSEWYRVRKRILAAIVQRLSYKARVDRVAAK